MATRDVVGGYPDGPGSEEAHRRALRPARILRAALQTPLSKRRLAVSRRFRLQAAGLGALAFVLMLALVLPARTITIFADGTVTTVSSRSASDAAVVEAAGVELQPADVITSSGDTLTVRRATEAVIGVDGRRLAARTQAETVGQLLVDSGIALGPQDGVRLDGAPVALDAPLTTSTAAPLALEVRRAVPFSVIENGHELQLRSSREALSTALRDAGVRVGPGDVVQPSLDTALTAGMQVRIEHATRVVVTLPEEKAMLYTLADDVGGALAESGVALPSEYRLEPEAGTPISAGLAVHVVGISREQELETVRIESFTVYEPDPTLPYGEQVTVPGQDGVFYREYEVEYQDGALVSRVLAAEWYDPEPVDTVIYYSIAAPAGGWSELVCSYSWDCGWAMAVIQCESGGNPNAYNPAGYVGLFQIWEGHSADLTDPATNIAAAYSLYASGGPGYWPNCP